MMYYINKIWNIIFIHSPEKFTQGIISASVRVFFLSLTIAPTDLNLRATFFQRSINLPFA